MKLFLIRHGETAYNAARRLQTPDVPLSDRGIAQAERLARRLAGEAIAHVVSSDYARAAMTAERVAAATGAPLSHDRLLQERNFGDLRGVPYAELGVDPFAPDYHPPNGESWQQLDERVDAAWARIRELARELEGDLAVVTHGLVCRSLVARHFELPGAGAPPDRYDNTSVTIAELGVPHRVRVLNCTAHLDDATGPLRRGGRA